ncbi:MAG: PA14 domain-containing protein [Nannocystaceae bacterium]
MTVRTIDPESPANPTPSALHAWSCAQGHALAAASLLDDPTVPSWSATVHVREGWSALVEAAARPGFDRAGRDDAVVIEDREIPWVEQPQRVAAALRELAGGDEVHDADPGPLRELSTALSAAVRRAQDERFEPGFAHARRRHWLRRAGMALLLLGPVAVGLVLTVPDYREGPWLGRYYANTTFEGEATVRRDGDVKFDWKRMGPTSELPDDQFSARWDTCMELPEDLEVAFQLVSDDGSRLFVDGRLAVDNWGRHGERSRGADVPLTAGWHHLRVEYFDERHGAKVELLASLRGELPDSLPVRLLRYPGDPLDEQDPCAATREP